MAAAGRRLAGAQRLPEQGKKVGIGFAAVATWSTSDPHGE
jgi:hypothetical protein